MKDGICPKCGSTEVFSGAHLPHWAKMGSSWGNIIPITAWTYTALDNYVCASCGYVEGYIGDRTKLAKIASKWPRAGQAGPRFEPLGTPPRWGAARACPQCGRALQDDWRACPYCGQPMV